ncbi:MAG: ATPase, T2SS/T4P/T4SS family [Bacteriovoracaceae bacterium]|nr:ATPase, T2SS/T4P/T4SS family [Bacteriovoracaceae bacterium]
MAGHIISIVGAKGGVGKSMVAANLAFAMAQENRQKVALIDADAKALGDQSLITSLKSPKNLKDLADVTGAISPQIVQSHFAHHRSGVSFVGMPNEVSIVEQISADGLGRALKSLAQIFPIIIVDVGSDLNFISTKVLEISTLIFIVSNQDMLAVNQTKRLLSELATMLFPKEMLQIILNQVVKGHPLGAEMIERQFNRQSFAQIPKDDVNCIQALSKSNALLSYSRSGPFAESILDITRKLKTTNILVKLEAMNRPQISAKSTGNVSSLNSSGSGKSDGQRFGMNPQARDPWTDCKARVHRQLVEEMDFKKAVNDDDPKQKNILREKTKKLVVDIISKEEFKALLKTREDTNQMLKEIMDEALGLGPLEDMLADPSVTEIMVVGPKKIYYEQGGKNKLSNVTFTNDRQVLTVIERIVSPIGRRIDEKTPYVDARLPNGSRVHAVIPPCAIDGCTITIRKFPENRLTYKDLIQYGSATQEMADFLRIAVEARRNIIVSGGTGSGKTTLINILGGFIPTNERIITCEDSAELNFPQDHVVRLETRPPSLEGEGEIDIRTLVKQTLRMKPDRIVVGECRGGEALDMLQAMNTGHDGSMTTVHSNSPRDAIGRIETLVQYAGAGLSPRSIKEMISSAVHLIVQQTRLEDGSRKIVAVTEVSGLQGDVITLQDVFTYKQEGINKQGKIVGKFQASGFIPKFIEQLERKGYRIPRGIFNNTNAA